MASVLKSSDSSDGTSPYYSLVLNNDQLTNVLTAVGIAGGATILTGSNITIASLCQSNMYSGADGQMT